MGLEVYLSCGNKFIEFLKFHVIQQPRVNYYWLAHCECPGLVKHNAVHLQTVYQR